MKKVLFLLIATLTPAAPAFAAPAVDFSSGSITTSAGADLGVSNTTIGGVVINAYVYSGSTTFTSSDLWRRNDGAGSGEHGLGVCSEGSTSCMTGGDVNELSNQKNIEIIRLTAPSGKDWSNIWVSSLDTGGTNNNETGTLFWSSSPTPNLSTLATFTTFSHTSTGFGSTEEGSIFSLLPAAAASADYLFFAAGSTPLAYGSTLNNDYLVWGVDTVNAIPESEIYAMLGVGLALMGFVARRRRQQGQA